MADPTQKFWIVLVNRSPQGPYSEDQLKDLLQKQTVSRNEVGMQVSADGRDRLSGWKILWQFEEFDRRRKKKDAEGAAPAPPIVERRASLSEPDLEKVTFEKVPPHLMEINPEDLVPHRGARSNTSQDFSQEDYAEPSRGQASSGDSSWWPTVAAGLGAVAVVVFGARWVSSWVSQEPAVAIKPQIKIERRITTQNRPARLPRQRTTPLSGVKAPEVKLPERPSPEPMQAESPDEVRDFGQVPEAVFDDVEDRADSLRRRIQQKGRNLRRRQGIKPLPAREEFENGEFADEEGFIDEEAPPEGEYYDEGPSEFDEGY